MHFVFSVTLGVRGRNCEWHCIKPFSPPPTFSFHHASKLKSIFPPREYLTDDSPKAYKPVPCLSLHYAREWERKSFVQARKKTVALWGIIMSLLPSLNFSKCQVPKLVRLVKAIWAFFFWSVQNTFQHLGRKCPHLHYPIQLAKDLFLVLRAKRVNHLSSPHLPIPSPNSLLGTEPGWCCSLLQAWAVSGRVLFAMSRAWPCTKQHEHSQAGLDPMSQSQFIY